MTQPHFAEVTVSPQNFKRISGNQFWIYPQLVRNAEPVDAAMSVMPSVVSGTLAHALPVTYETPGTLAPNNIGVELTPSVVIP